MQHEITEYPPKPKNPTGEFYHHYGHEKPVRFDRWEWSNTFNRWGAFVEFSDGWRGFTYPKESSGGLIVRYV